MPTTRKTNTHAATDLNECGLCYESFGPKDDVVYCMKNHVFHVHCFDDHTGTRDSMTSDAQTQDQIDCPTCGAVMLGLENITLSQVSSRVDSDAQFFQIKKIVDGAGLSREDKS